MATLTEQRENLNDLYTSAVRKGSEVREARVADVRPPDYRADEVHYRTDYGSTMDDYTYNQTVASDEAYKKSLMESNKEIESRQKDVDARYTSGMNQVNAAHLPAKDFQSFYNTWTKANTVPISIYNGDTYEATYRLDHESAHSFLSSIQGSGFFTVRHNDDGSWTVDNKGYGKELHEPLFEYVNKLPGLVEEAYNKEYGTAQRALEIERASAKDALNTSLNSANATLSSQREMLSTAENQHLMAISNIRFKYQNKLNQMNNTATGLRING